MSIDGPGASKPGWQERAIRGIATSKRTSKQSSLSVDVPYQFKALLAQAARSRGISQAGFIRRSVAAFVASELGMPYQDVLAGMQSPFPNDNSAAGWAALEFIPGKEDTGEGFGDWKNLAL
jgi:hypothetical protein